MKVKPKKFAVKVEGVPLSRLKKYGNIIEVRAYGKVKTKNNVNNIIKYEKHITEKQYSNGKIDPIVEDLINIALATFCVDSMVQRSVSKSRFFSRDIRITIPVSDKERWNKVKPLLERTISFMTYDIFKYNFIKRKGNDLTNKPKKSSFDSIALFSGGLDSFAGSHFLLSKGYNPIFLSVNHSGIGKVVSKLYKSLPEKSQKILLSVEKKIDSVEYTQFSRSFLYLTLAISIARAYNNINKVFIPENGIIAFQIGLKEGRYGTRTAHPRYLNYFSSLIKNLFPSWTMTIENPFIYKTKGEVVSLLKNNERLIGKTISCGHSARFGHSHCGMCIPCIIRRISLVVNGIYNDRISKYGKNAFLINFDNVKIEENISRPNNLNKSYYRDAVVNILQLLQLVKNIKKSSDDELIIKYPEMINPEIMNMYKRFASEVIRTLNYFKKINQSLNKFITFLTDGDKLWRKPPAATPG